MSAHTPERTHGHHHSDTMRGAAQAITEKQPSNASLAVSLVEPENRPPRQRKT